MIKLFYEPNQNIRVRLLPE